MVPADRRGAVIVPTLSIRANLALPNNIRRAARRFGLRWPGHEKEMAAYYVERLSFPYYGLMDQPQMRYMLKNTAAICEAAGTTLGNIVRRTCFHVSGNDFAESMTEWASHFPNRKPCSTTLIIGGPLVVEGANTLLDMIAYVPD
jgi:hypothetical protein